MLVSDSSMAATATRVPVYAGSIGIIENVPLHMCSGTLIAQSNIRTKPAGDAILDELARGLGITYFG